MFDKRQQPEVTRIFDQRNSILLTATPIVRPKRCRSFGNSTAVRSAALLLVLFSGVGCRNVRSIFQMDSNSPSPFLGLQLSVDRSKIRHADVARTDQPSTLDSDRLLSRHILTSTASGEFQSSEDARAAETTAVDNDRSYRRSAASGQSTSDESEFFHTADSRMNRGDLKYSFPLVDLKTDHETAAEVQDILNRLNGR